MGLSSRTIIIIAVVVMTALIGYVFFFGSRSTDQDQGGSPLGAPQQNVIIPLDPDIVPIGEKITIGTARGSVEVNNFYKIAKGLDGDVLIISATSEYQVVYNGEVSAFGIYVIGGAVDPARKAAESELLGILGISQAQACSLEVSWAVSYAVDKSLAGRSYPLSFCVPGVQ